MPWGKYEYQRLPMGFSNSPDICQEKFSGLMQGLDFVRAYIDDLFVFSNDSFGDHMSKHNKVLHRIQKMDSRSMLSNNPLSSMNLSICVIRFPGKVSSLYQIISRQYKP